MELHTKRETIGKSMNTKSFPVNNTWCNWQSPWQRHPFAIMKGFGFFTIIGMLANLLRSDFGTKMDTFFAYAPPVAYIVACFIWLGGFLVPEPATFGLMGAALAGLVLTRRKIRS